ncbi:hypothetical protein OS493_023121 [Desmophyllum pertusum]|uniref:Uncharacterized protein n=1 Tax=Desmophyllum pertusum TaxID=174260 RepID=A0A9W9Z161_9CNID|nr:hypothetical protein OS493_023121 [Desmophyllum pertusum]
MVIGVEAILIMALFAPVTQGVTTYNTGAGTLYTLKVVQDVTLEHSRNMNYLAYLLVSKHPQYPNKRSLVQFENLPSACPSSKVKSAKMYLYYVYAHKASWHSITTTPFIPRYMEVRLVKKAWKETQATRYKRYSYAYWSSPWLDLDGRDSEAVPQECTPVTIYPLRPSGFVEFDITYAVRSWRSGVPNYGLVIRATNELESGRGIRFASNAYRSSSRHAFARVLCG